MDNLLRDRTPLELWTWLDPDSELPGWDILRGHPFGGSQLHDRLTAVQSYFAEYHLEYFRQRFYPVFPSRLHALVLFATLVDAETFRHKHPARVFGKTLRRTRSKGPYVCSFHDASWLDYLRLPHSLTLSTLDDIADYYWQGTLVEEVGLTFMNERWREPPVIEALFQGTLEVVAGTPCSAWLPGFG